MALPENNPNRSIIVYQGAPLERIDTRALIFQEGHPSESRFFIPEDIIAGRYGVVGFLVVDKTPENRWVSYTNSEWTGVPCISDYGNPLHHLNTDRGFKMIRYFVLPPQVAEFFAKDRFLGEPLIDKCCREGTLPEEFDEDKAHPGHAFGDAAFSNIENELIDAAIKTSLPHLTDEELRRYGNGNDQYSYVSFHPWQEFKYIIQEGQKSVHAAINNFDNVLARFDVKQLLSPRDLIISSGDSPQIQATQ